MKLICLSQNYINSKFLLSNSRQFSFPIAAVLISFLSINYKLFKSGDLSSEQIDLSIDRITPNDAEMLIWLQDSMVDKNHLQRELHKVIERENIRAKYLSFPRNIIEQGG